MLAAMLYSLGGNSKGITQNNLIEGNLQKEI